MELLVSYDVATVTEGGQSRLRKIARVCEGSGQRVQKSVFECVLDRAGLERLMADLSKVMDPDEDTVRIYRLREQRAQNLWEMGRVLAHDIHDALVI